MTSIIGTGFNAGSDDGEFATLESDLRALAEMGVDTVEIGVTSLDLIAGGRIIRERHEALVARRSNSISATRCTGSSRPTSWTR